VTISEQIPAELTMPLGIPYASLAAQMQGRLVLPSDEGYDEARRIYNAMIDRRPAAIAFCESTADIAAAIRFAVEHDVPISVRGGGHAVSGSSVIDAGLVIDVGAMKGLQVDVDRRIAVAQPGLRLGEFIEGTEVFGLVTPTGTVSDTGLAGLTLGAGYGYLSGKYGLAVDNLIGAEVVTADGSVLRASETENPDLFWAIRGGSGNFGVVTSFEFTLHPVTQVLGGLLVYPGFMATDMLRFYRGVATSAPDELTVFAALMTAPDGNPAVAMAVCWCGETAEGERVLETIRAFGPPVMDTIAQIPYSAMNTLVDGALSNGFRNYWKWNGLRELTDEAIDAIVAQVAVKPSPRSIVLIDQVHGAAGRVPPTATAFPHRDAPHGLVVLAIWDDPADDEINKQWARALDAATAPFSTGGFYVNGASDDKPSAAYGANLERLRQIKAKYDPTNLFRHNTNITPA
jgi:FAD/FMN-containing dehydrogenase